MLSWFLLLVSISLIVVVFLRTPLCAPAGFSLTVVIFQSHRPLLGLLLDINIIILSTLLDGIGFTFYAGVILDWKFKGC